MLIALTVGIVLVSCYIALHVTAAIVLCLIGSDDTIRGAGTPPELVREYYESHYPLLCMPKRYGLFLSDDD